LEITVNLYGDLRQYRAAGKSTSMVLRVPAGLTVAAVLDYLKIPTDRAVSVVVNGEHRGREHQLADGDVISMFSMAAFEE
jgi:molybdopterin converting factor small subunit